MIRIVVIDDSPLTVEMLRGLFDAEPDMCVVGAAAHGAAGLALARSLRPDLVTMDIRMPVMDGIAATCAIMEEAPCPVLVVADAVKEDTGLAFRAIQAGAIDAVDKPILGPAGETSRRELVRHARLVASVPPLRRARRPVAAATSLAAEARVIAIAASTGGPPALAHVLGAFARETPLVFVVVQHIAPGFLSGFVDWLSGEIRLDVRVARQGDELRAGTAWFAPEGHHVLVGPDRRLALSTEPPRDGHRPSATTLFESVARACGSAATGVLLTGVGRDGAQGLAALRAAGARTICQDAATSVVHGMPQAAIELGAAEKVLPLEAIAAEIASIRR